jgi:uncharacterized protein YegL
MKIKWLIGIGLFLAVTACDNINRQSMPTAIVLAPGSAAKATAAPIGMVTSAGTPAAAVIVPTVVGSGAVAPTSVPAAGATGAPSIVATPIPQSDRMTAAEIDDNVLWDDYLKYRQQHSNLVVHQVNVSERYVISVTTAQGNPVLGAHVRIYGDQRTLLSDTYTYSNGKTLFFPLTKPEATNATSFYVMIDKNGFTSQFDLARHEKSEWQVALAGQPQMVNNPISLVKLDVLFLMDTTGSMGDELAQLQANILSVTGKIGQLPGQPDAHYGIVAYRDRGDEYITRIFPFTTDVQKFQSDLSSLSAGGGGDNPESLNAALHDAVHGVDWRGDDTIKLIFLVSDAPPHLDYPDDYDYAVEMAEAARRGIKIYSLAASGLDEQGEYIFRQMSEYTMGHFIFITYANGSSGAPGDNTQMNVPKSDYQVELLDQLVLRLIRQEVLTVVQAQGGAASS